MLLLLIQGRFEILSLSGSFLLSGNGGQQSRTGGLSVALSDPDGRVLGGGVAGLLTAASPVQVSLLFTVIFFIFVFGFQKTLLVVVSRSLNSSDILHFFNAVKKKLIAKITMEMKCLNIF